MRECWTKLWTLNGTSSTRVEQTLSPPGKWSYAWHAAVPLFFSVFAFFSYSLFSFVRVTKIKMVVIYSTSSLARQRMERERETSGSETGHGRLFFYHFLVGEIQHELWEGGVLYCCCAFQRLPQTYTQLARFPLVCHRWGHGLLDSRDVACMDHTMHDAWEQSVYVRKLFVRTMTALPVRLHA